MLGSWLFQSSSLRSSLYSHSIEQRVKGGEEKRKEDTLPSSSHALLLSNNLPENTVMEGGMTRTHADLFRVLQ